MAGPTPLDELFSVDELTATVKSFAEQEREHSASTLFAKWARPIAPEGEIASWDEVPFQRSLAPVTGPDSPHPQVRRLKPRRRNCVMCSIRAYKDLPLGHVLLNRGPRDEVVAAEKHAAMELEDLAILIANTREYLAAGALLGQVVVNGQTVPGSDIAFTIEFGNHRVRAVTPWSDPGAPIRSGELLRLKRLYKDGSGLTAGVALSEPGIERHLLQNVEVRELVKGELGAEVLQNLELTGISPQWDGLAGLSFHFTDGTYKPEGGAVTRYFPQDTVIVLPPVRRLANVIGWAQGRQLVPAGERYGPVTGIGNRFRETRGFYAYAEIRSDPLGIRIYAGWTGLPVILDPNAVLVYRTGALAGVP
jgi:hypothetical protein